MNFRIYRMALRMTSRTSFKDTLDKLKVKLPRISFSKTAVKKFKLLPVEVIDNLVHFVDRLIHQAPQSSVHLTGEMVFSE